MVSFQLVVETFIYCLGIYTFIAKYSSVRLERLLNPFSANFAEWSNTLKQFVGNLPTTCLSVFGHFVGLALKGLKVSRNPKH